MEYKYQVSILRHPSDLISSALRHPRQYWCSDNASQAILRFKKNALTEGWRGNRDQCHRAGWMAGKRKCVRSELGIGEADRGNLLRQEMTKLGWDVTVDDYGVNNVARHPEEDELEDWYGDNMAFDDSLLTGQRQSFQDCMGRPGYARRSVSFADSGYATDEEVHCGHSDVAVDPSELSKACISHRPSRCEPPFFVKTSEVLVKLGTDSEVPPLSYASFDRTEHMEATEAIVEHPRQSDLPQVAQRVQIDPSEQMLGHGLIREQSRLLHSPNYCFWPLDASLLTYHEHVKMASQSRIPLLVITSPEGNLSTLTECHTILSKDQCAEISARRNEQILARKMEYSRHNWDLYARAKFEGASQAEYDGMKVARAWWDMEQKKWDKEFGRKEKERERGGARDDEEIVDEPAVVPSGQGLIDAARRDFDNDSNEKDNFDNDSDGKDNFEYEGDKPVPDLVEMARKVIDSPPYTNDNDDSEPTTIYEKAMKDLHDANESVNRFLAHLDRETEARIDETILENACRASHAETPYALATLLNRMATTEMITPDHCSIDVGQTYFDYGKRLIVCQPSLTANKVKCIERKLVTVGRHTVVFTDRVAAVVRDRFEDICAEWSQVELDIELEEKEKREKKAQDVREREARRCGRV